MTLSSALSGCLYGGEPVLLVGPALVGMLDLTSLLHGNFLALVVRMDVARMHTLIYSSPPRRASLFQCVYMKNFQPYSPVNENKFH